jgi:hypothetical protein
MSSKIVFGRKGGQFNKVHLVLLYSCLPLKMITLFVLIFFSVNGRFFEAQRLVNIPKKLTLLNCPPFLPNTILEDMLINVGQIEKKMRTNSVIIFKGRHEYNNTKCHTRCSNNVLALKSDSTHNFFSQSHYGLLRRSYPDDDPTSFGYYIHHLE